MEKITTDAVVYGVVCYKVFEPLFLKITGKKEKQCDFMETRVRALENKVAVLETQNENFDKKLDSMDKKLDELITRKQGGR